MVRFPLWLIRCVQQPDLRPSRPVRKVDERKGHVTTDLRLTTAKITANSAEFTGLDYVQVERMAAVQAARDILPEVDVIDLLYAAEFIAYGPGRIDG